MAILLKGTQLHPTTIEPGYLPLADIKSLTHNVTFKPCLHHSTFNVTAGFVQKQPLLEMLFKLRCHQDLEIL